MTKRIKQLDTLMGKLMSAGSVETARKDEHQKEQRSYYNKAKRLAKKIGGRIEIERYGTENNYWVFGPDKVEKHPDWKDDEHFQTCWVGVYDFLIEVVNFIEEKNL